MPADSRRSRYPADDRPPQEAPAARAEDIVTKDRAKRFVYRIEQIATERRAHYMGQRIGMTSFVEAVPTMVALEEDMAASIDAVLNGRAHDRERGETEIPFVVAIEGVLERTRRARQIEEARRSNRTPAAWAQERLLALLADAVKRLNAFAEVYDAKRFLSVPAATDLAHVLSRVEDDVAVERPPAAGFTPTSLAKSPVVDRKVPALVTSADALEDLLRAARAEVAGVTVAKPPWRATRVSSSDPFVLSIGAALADGVRGPLVPGTGRATSLTSEFAQGGDEDGEEDAGAAPGTPTTAASASPPRTFRDLLLGPGPAAARTDRAVMVLKFAHGVHVTRAQNERGETTSVEIAIADGTASTVAKRLAPGAASGAASGATAGTTPGEAVALSPDADAAMRAYVLAAGKDADPLSPSRLVAVMGVMRAVDKALDRVLRPLLDASAASVVANSVPRESSRKAPVHREVLATLSAAVPGFPSHRASEVLDAAADGKAGPAATRPPDAAVLLAVLARRWPTGKPFGDVVVGRGVWSDDDAMQSIKDVVRLSEIRTALDRGRDPGPQWADSFEAAAFGLLARLARLRPAAA